MYVAGNADITGRVSDYMSLAAWFKLVETDDDTDELEAFSVVDTLMVSISLILAFIQDQRKQQGVCWEEALLSNMVNTSLRQQQPLEPTEDYEAAAAWRCSRRWRRSWRGGWKGGSKGLTSILSGLLQASRRSREEPQHQLRREPLHQETELWLCCHIETGEGCKNWIAPNQDFPNIQK